MKPINILFSNSIFRIAISCLTLFLFIICPISAQQKTDESVNELNDRSTILNYIDLYCKSYADKDIAFFKDNFEDCLRLLPNNEKMSGRNYLQALNRLFERDKEVSVLVEDIKIVQLPNKLHFYGVNMVMTYNNGSYKDKGYCFWMIDLRNPKQIRVHISTWQPYETTPEEEIYGIKNFNMKL